MTDQNNDQSDKSEIAGILEANPILGTLEPRFRRLIEGCSREVSFNKGQRMLNIGDPADRFWIIQSGLVDIEIHGARFGTRTIDRLEPGELLGVSWIAAPYLAEFDATAVEDVTAIEVDAVCVRAKSAGDREFGHELTSRFAALIRDRLHATRLQLIDLYENTHAG